jgi:hypothetical protein
MRKAADKLIERAEKHLKARFEQRGWTEDLPYHGVEHTKDVIKNAREILSDMKAGGAAVSERDLMLVEVAAAGHDLIQEWRTRDTAFQPITPDKYVLTEAEIKAREKKRTAHLTELQKLEKKNGLNSHPPTEKRQKLPGP